MTIQDRRKEFDLKYARMMGKAALLAKMRYHNSKIKEHTEDKQEALRLIVLLRENI